MDESEEGSKVKEVKEVKGREEEWCAGLSLGARPFPCFPCCQ